MDICERCGQEKTESYLGVCFDCWMVDTMERMYRGALPFVEFSEVTSPEGEG